MTTRNVAKGHRARKFGCFTTISEVGMKRVVLALLLLQLANGGCDRWQSREVSDPPKRAPVKDDANRSVAEGGEYTQLFVPLSGVPPSEGCQLKDYSYASEVKCFALSEGDLVRTCSLKMQILVIESGCFPRPTSQRSCYSAKKGRRPLSRINQEPGIDGLATCISARSQKRRLARPCCR